MAGPSSTYTTEPYSVITQPLEIHYSENFEPILPQKFVKSSKDLEIEKTTARIFHYAISTTVKEMATRNIAPTVTVHEPSEYEQMKALFLSKDYSCGAAINTDDIVSVFKHPEGPSGATEMLLPLAVKAGGKRLDCFNVNGILPTLYSKYGFVPVAKLPFNTDPEIAPKGWDCKVHQTPDLIFMAVNFKTALNGSTLTRTERASKINEIINALEYSANYDEAERTQKRYTIENN